MRSAWHRDNALSSHQVAIEPVAKVGDVGSICGPSLRSVLVRCSKRSERAAIKSPLLQPSNSYYSPHP